MKIGVTSQNYRTITGHAGKTRRFLVYSTNDQGEVVESGRLDLPLSMSMQAFRGDHHPIDDLDILITGGCGEGFKNRMASRGVRVITTSETDPMKAITAVISGKTPPQAAAKTGSVIRIEVQD